MSAAVLDRDGPVEQELREVEPSMTPARVGLHEAVPRTPAFADLRRRAAGAINPYDNQVRLINVDNSSAGKVMWTPEVATRPFAVRLAHRGRYVTIGLDFDAKADGADRVAFEADAAMLMFRQVGIAAVMCTSGPTGGRHVFVTIGGEGITAKSARRLVQGMGRLGWRTLDPSPMTNPVEGAIRPPFAAHRLGGHSLVMDLDAAAAVAKLEERADPERVSAVVDAVHRLSNRRRRAKRQVELSTTTKFENGYKSGSEAAAAVAASVANAYGDDFAQFQRVLDEVERASQLGEHLAERGRDEAYLRRTFANAVIFVREHPARGGGRPDHEVLDAWGAALAGCGLRASHIAAARTVHRVASDHRRVLIGMSSRELALLTGMSPATAARALTSLTAAKMLEVMADSPGSGRRYRLLHPDEWEVPGTETVGPPSTGGVGLQTVSIAGTSSDQLADDIESRIWSHLGIGPAANHVFRALCAAVDGGSAQRQVIMEVADLSGSQVDGMLDRLREHGLAERVARGRWVPLFPNVEVVVASLGIQEATAAQAEQFNRESILNKVRVIKWMVERTTGAAA